MIDHERLLTELIRTFFVEFLDLFVPQISIFLERDRVRLLADPVGAIPGVHSGGADILAAGQIHGEESLILVHVAGPDQPRHEVGRDLFRRFSWLYEQHGQPVCPIAVLADDEAVQQDPGRFRVALPHKLILDFAYSPIQLGRLNWRDYVRKSNPVAAALMSRMRVSAEERARVKMESLRLLSTLGMDKLRTKIVATYIETYLPLSPDEEKQLRWKLDLGSLDLDAIAVQVNPAQSSRQGKLELVLRQLNCRTGMISNETADRISKLDARELDELGEALLGFNRLGALEEWLERNAPALQYA